MLLIPEAKALHQAATGRRYDAVLMGLGARGMAPVPHRFYCRWLFPGDVPQRDPEGNEIVGDVRGGTCCFTHRVGLPVRKWEPDLQKEITTESLEEEAERLLRGGGQDRRRATTTTAPQQPDQGSAPLVTPVELTDSNYRLLRAYHRHRLLSQNKSRGSGASEIFLRYMIFKYGVLNTTRNRKCLIMPGTSSKLSREFSGRIKAIADRVPSIYEGGTAPTTPHPSEFRFASGGQIILTTATPDAGRGYENVGDFIQEEVAHWDMIDDRPVYYTVQGVHEKTRCHVLHNTTPRGRRGFYWDLVWSPGADTAFHKHLVNWRQVVGLPVRTVEELFPLQGRIDEARLKRLRASCLRRYRDDPGYRAWYDGYFVDDGEIIPIDDLVAVPIPLLDINAIILEAMTNRPHYDQELDNQFLSGEHRAIGDFEEADYTPYDLRAQIAEYDTRRRHQQEGSGGGAPAGDDFNEADYE